VSRLRTVAVTGSASGIGAALCTRLRDGGAQVVGVDRHDADVVADLGSPPGRVAAIEGVARACGGVLDAIVSCAGIASTEPEVLRVNYFGAVAMVSGTRPLLASGADPRAVVVTSASVVHPVDDDVVEACLAHEEERACALPGATGARAYASGKRALARWVRRHAPTPDWAGSGIALNAIAPGTVETPLSAPVLADAAGARYIDRAVPMPLAGHARAEEIAPILAFLAGPECRHVTGQVLFVDGGADAVLTGDDIWGSAELPEYALGLTDDGRS
jgi:NAD(P)-dependent dehydrogenase (short-subunit alcohol dehydrogenase family)